MSIACGMLHAAGNVVANNITKLLIMSNFFFLNYWRDQESNIINVDTRLATCCKLPFALPLREKIDVCCDIIEVFEKGKI